MLRSGSWKARRAQTEDAVHSDWEAVEYPAPSATSISLPLPSGRGLDGDVSRLGRGPSNHWRRRLFPPRKKGPTTLSAIAAVHRVASVATLASGPGSYQSPNQPSSHETSGLELGSWRKLFIEPTPLAQSPTDEDNSPATPRAPGSRAGSSNVVPTPTAQPARSRQTPADIQVVQESQARSVTVQDDSAQTIIFGPQATQFDSPLPLTQGTQINEQAHSTNVFERRRLNTISDEILSLDVMISSIFSAVGIPTQGTTSTFGSWKTANQCERRLLIIGGGYSERTPRTSEDLELESLLGAVKDREYLRSAFLKRGYSVETLVEEDTTRIAVLNRVAEFLEPAQPGDVRAIVFTGHSIRLQGHQETLIVPPGAETLDDYISANEWSENIRDSTKPGVIVLSIFASCFSGTLMQQSVKLTDFNCPVGPYGPPPALDAASLESSQAPIFITFSSSNRNEKSYESEALSLDSEDSQSITDPQGVRDSQSVADSQRSEDLQDSEDSQDSHICDNFLWALAATARDPRVRDWGDFVRTLHTAFYLARSFGALAETDPLEWLLEHRQHPQITMSQVVPPRLQDLFPEPIEVT
ncbi:hypothetical protein BDV93DRAFT_608126 [Ceratobasidium sp. AG-I]|nr:hypothetical protein BDV93DRAFT_608126 [Ceratobasidium sp. AG-I]